MGVSIKLGISQNSQSVANNTSNVTVVATLYWSGGSWNNNKKWGYVSIDGTDYEFTANFNWNGASSSGSTEVFNKTVNVKHNSDGSKNLYCYAYYETGVSAGNIETEASKTLTTIPRQGALTSAQNFTDEESPTITYSNPAGNGATALEAAIGWGNNDDIAYRAIPKTGTSYTFNFTAAERNKIRNAIPNDKSMTVTFYMRTTIGGNVYYSSIQKTCSIVNANPTISPTVEDVNAATIALTGDKTKLIRYHSNAAITIGAAAIKGATLKSQKATNGSKSISTVTGTIEAVESGRFAFVASDSRGNTTRKTVDYPVIEYVKLTCNIGNNTPDTQGNFVFTLSGNYFSGSFGTVSNTLTVEYRYKEGYGEYSAWKKLTPTLSGNTYTATDTFTGLDYQTVYTFQARAVDRLNTILTVEKPIKSAPVFDWGKDDFKFNVSVEMPRLTINGHEIVGNAGNATLWSGASHMNGNQTINLTEPVSAQPSGIVLVFSGYDNQAGTALDVSWATHYVPKEMVNINSGGGQLFMMAVNAGFSTFGGKYLYINDNSITGHATNTNSGTNGSGITFSNANYVLRAVIGV